MCVALWNKITVSKQHRGTGKWIRSKHTGVIKEEGFRKFGRFFTVGDENNLLENFEVQAWANDLTEEDPLLGCNIKVNSFFNQSYLYN